MPNYSKRYGFEIMDSFDYNNDGIIDNKDNTNLALWTDINKNGKTELGELIYLNDINSPIKSISLSKLDKLLSGYDRNSDLKINVNDTLYNYIYVQENSKSEFANLNLLVA